MKIKLLEHKPGTRYYAGEIVEIHGIDEQGYAFINSDASNDKYYFHPYSYEIYKQNIIEPLETLTVPNTIEGNLCIQLGLKINEIINIINKTSR